MAEKISPAKKFIGEEITVLFNILPVFIKRPSCPDGFIWQNERFIIRELMMAWDDFSRRGSTENNMSPEHAARAAIKGSWGVGRYYFLIDTKVGRRFEICYDRSPEKSDDRRGHWFLLNEHVK